MYTYYPNPLPIHIPLSPSVTHVISQSMEKIIVGANDVLYIELVARQPRLPFRIILHECMALFNLDWQ